MPYTIYDYRRDIKNLIVTPRIRSRFLRMEPGEVHSRHSHDLGHEVFLILEGRCELEIDGERAVLGPGQLCVAFAHQMHQARNAGDGPMVMYLSVTPHIEPTHTHYDPASGDRLPPSYHPPTAFDQAAARVDQGTADLADDLLIAAQAHAATVESQAAERAEAVALLKQAARDGDTARLKLAMDRLCEQVCAAHDSLDALSVVWNDLAARAAR